MEDLRNPLLNGDFLSPKVRIKDFMRPKSIKDALESSPTGIEVVKELLNSMFPE
ncbi:hypothetical protein KY285_010322 [Solanum tuberosum]|nr:hypothetical protein KY289_010870 [Solanum tuberosum]KAH0709003.1 hypothetical protein KY284_010430 [Solanum tuberosum]KAH0734615.1 hypothetical protein KY285_010322 [Solanum tuberosum]